MPRGPGTQEAPTLAKSSRAGQIKTARNSPPVTAYPNPSAPPRNPASSHPNRPAPRPNHIASANPDPHPAIPRPIPGRPEIIGTRRQRNGFRLGSRRRNLRSGRRRFGSRRCCRSRDGRRVRVRAGVRRLRRVTVRSLGLSSRLLLINRHILDAPLDAACGQQGKTGDNQACSPSNSSHKQPNDFDGNSTFSPA